ncbi:hypothetical protein, partial [Microseira wollei]|uniref:hypothetical protein n=1 Tax=Microseira wollei TaxID=467598 RepID=UPI001CFEA07A
MSTNILHLLQQSAGGASKPSFPGSTWEREKPGNEKTRKANTGQAGLPPHKRSVTLVGWAFCPPYADITMSTNILHLLQQ